MPAYDGRSRHKHAGMWCRHCTDIRRFPLNPTFHLPSRRLEREGGGPACGAGSSGLVLLLQAGRREE